MEKTLEQRIEELERKVAELEGRVPEQLIENLIGKLNAKIQNTLKVSV